MSFKITIIYLLVLAGFLYSCSGTKKSTKPSKPVIEITEKDKYTASSIFVDAVAQRELGNLEKALALYEKVISINSDDAAAYYEKARLLHAMGRSDEAITAINKSVQIEPLNKWYKVLKGNILKTQGNYTEYVNIYNKLVDLYPTDLNFLNELAYGYYYLGDYENAILVYNRIEEQIGINESLTTQKVKLYTNLGKTDMAINEYERLIQINPDESRYYALLAEYSAKNNMNEKAIWAYEKIVEINPDDPYVHISLADFYRKAGEDEKSFEELKIGLANPNLDLKTKVNLLFTYYSGELTNAQRKQALTLSEILRATHPDDPLSETFYASMLFENKEYEKAKSLLLEILDEDVSNYGLWEQLLFCDLNLEDYESLARNAEQVVDLFPSYPLPYFFAGIASFQLKDFVKAKAFLELGKDFVVNNNVLLEQFYSSLGDTYNELENYEASYKAYDKALGLNPDNSVVLNNYAYYLALRSVKLEKAATMAKKSVDLDPYNHNNLDTYAWVLYKQGKYEQSLDWIKKAYNNGGDNSGVVLEHFGDIYFKLNKPEKAMEYWKRASEKKEHSELLDRKIKDGVLYE